MQLAEQGKLDIDRPVTDYAPQFRIVVPFDDAPPITPRLLMGHRAGMIRESPVGGYFDPNEPSLDATVASTGRLRAGASARHGDEVFQHRGLGQRLAGGENHRHAVSRISKSGTFSIRWA